MAFELPALAYATDALEPHIDKTTMEIHHGKHHQAYVTNLNKALEGKPEANSSIDDIIKNISKHPAAVRNNGGGHYNHSLFWTVLGPNKGGEPTGDLAKAINETFGSFADLKTKLQFPRRLEMGKAAKCRSGSLSQCYDPKSGTDIPRAYKIKNVRISNDRTG